MAVAFGRTLDAIDVLHLVGGSLASWVHGEPRSTNDVRSASAPFRFFRSSTYDP